MTRKCGIRSPCAIANGLEVLGDRWTLLIIRDLMFTNRCEFSHFMKSGEGISTNILSERLERLQDNGIISKRPHSEHGKKFVYALTDMGLKLAPTVIELTLWASKNITNTFVPLSLLDLMENDRDKLLNRINQRQSLVQLEL